MGLSTHEQGELAVGIWAAYAVAAKRTHDSMLSLQVNQLQQDVARFERQAVGAQQSSDSWQQTAHHLRAELVDKEKHTAEEDGMHAEVRPFYICRASLTAVLAQHSLHVPLWPPCQSCRGCFYMPQLL